MEGGVLYAVVERDPSSKDQRSAGAHNTPSFRPVLSLLSWIVLRYQEEASESIYVCLWVLDASCMVQQMHYIGIAPFGHRRASKNKKICHILPIFLVLGNLTHKWFTFQSNRRGNVRPSGQKTANLLTRASWRLYEIRHDNLRLACELVNKYDHWDFLSRWSGDLRRHLAPAYAEK